MLVALIALVQAQAPFHAKLVRVENRVDPGCQRWQNNARWTVTLEVVDGPQQGQRVCAALRDLSPWLSGAVADNGLLTCDGEVSSFTCGITPEAPPPPPPPRHLGPLEAELSAFKADVARAAPCADPALREEWESYITMASEALAAKDSMMAGDLRAFLEYVHPEVAAAADACAPPPAPGAEQPPG